MSGYGQQMKDRLLMQFGKSSYLQGLFDVFGVELDLLTTVFAELHDDRWVDAAIGAQLDGCGVIVGQDRSIPKTVALPFFGFISQTSTRGFGLARFLRRGEPWLSSTNLGDEDYRTLIKVKIAKNTGSGTPEEVITSFKSIFNADKIILTETGSATIRIGVARKLLEGEIIFAEAVNLYIKPGGVNIVLKTYFEPGASFGFKSQGLQGFGRGKLAKTFEGGLSE